MEGENLEDTSNQQPQAEDAAPEDQTAISPLVDGLLPSNSQDNANPPNEDEAQAQSQPPENENEVASTPDEISNRVENLIPSNDNGNTQVGDENQPIQNEAEPQTSDNQQPLPSEPTNPEIDNQQTTQDEAEQPTLVNQQAEQLMQPPPNNDSQAMENNDNLQNTAQSQPPEQAPTSTDADNTPAPQIRMPNTARISNTPRHFYPSMPQTARTGKSCRFVKTRPGTSRANPYISRKISSYAVPIVQLRSSYQSMDTQLHSLVANCNIEAISPELMMVYKRLDKAYDIFCQQANQLLSSQDPNAIPRTQEKTSAIYKVSEDLVNEWVTFIRLFNNTISKGSTPFFQIISGRLSRILGMFRQLNDRFNIGMMKIAFTRDGMRRVDSEIVILRRECNTKYRNCEGIDQEFADKVKKVITRVENVFKNSVTKATMYTAEIMRLKSELHIEASDLKTNVDAMVVFDKSAGLTRAEIANVNEVFNNLFQLMRLPLELKLKYEDDMSENEKAENKKEEEKTKTIETSNANPNRKIEKNNSMKVCLFENMI